MPNINKLLNKVNQASQALKSAKGIKAKIQQAGYKGGVNTEEVDKLQEQAEENRRKLEERRGSLEKQLSSVNKANTVAKKPPELSMTELQYPMQGGYDYYVVFETRVRKPRAGGNFLSKETFSIALYLPEDIVQQSQTTYKAEGVGAMARGIDSALNKKEGEKVDGMLDEAGNVIKGFMNKLGDSMSGGIRNLKAGMASNPMEEQFLEGITFRDHSFEWEFMPRNSKEAIMVQKIVNIFRLAMLPDTFAADKESANENFFNYPNVFDVHIEGPEGGVQDQIEGFLPMVLKDMTVNTFNGNSEGLISDGEKVWPLATKIELSFSEIKIMSQEVYNEKVGPKSMKAQPNSVRGPGGTVDSTGSPSLLNDTAGTGDGKLWGQDGGG